MVYRVHEVIYHLQDPLGHVAMIATSITDSSCTASDMQCGVLHADIQSSAHELTTWLPTANLAPKNSSSKNIVLKIFFAGSLPLYELLHSCIETEKNK